MSYTKNKILDFITPLVDEKIEKIGLSLRIKIIKNNLYEKIIKSVYNILANELTVFIVNKIDAIDVNVINHRLDKIMKLYLSSIKQQRE